MMKIFKGFWVFVLAAILAGSGCNNAERLFIVDAQGGDLVLHGANISNAAKREPLHVGWHGQADYDRMIGWGMNAVRLLIFWTAIEPEEGVFDNDYLDRVEERLDWAQAAGLYVLMDMHQDTYGEKFGGNGAPVWATRDDGIPFDHVSPWWLNYAAPAVRRAFYHLWIDADLQEHYRQSWTVVAERFGNHPAVLGYEIMNEPYFGDINPFIFEKDFLYPFTRYVAEGIRSADPDGLIFFEPMIITNLGIPSFGPSIEINDSVYAPHFYQPAVHEGQPYDLDPSLINSTAKTRSRESARHGTPWLLTEFGVASTTTGYEQYLEDLLRALDEQSAGWFYWSYDKGGGFCMLQDDGSESPVMDHLVRPYPQRTTGRLASYTFDPDTRVFEMAFENRAGATGETEIFVAASRVYGGSFQVGCSDAAGTWSYTFDPAREIVSVQTDPGTSEHTITITP
ncbi:cellulase family glycosylhydrolase [Thermodesulfobacteriota bacterium]